MKNLFNISEEEKNRIMGLHESSTKNHYLISEQASVEKQIAGQIYTASYGTGTDEDNFVNAMEKISSLQQLISIDNLLKNGYSRLGLQGQINDEFNPQEYGDRSYLEKIKSKLSSLGAQLTYDQVRNGSVKIQFGVQTMPEDVNAQVKAHAQYCKWGDDIQGFLDSGKKCPKPGSDSGSTGGSTGGTTGGSKTTESSNQTRIKELQRKVGVKDDGILGKITLKAIMDKLSQ